MHADLGDRTAIRGKAVETPGRRDQIREGPGVKEALLVRESTRG
jgi:hypothetical protein